MHEMHQQCADIEHVSVLLIALICFHTGYLCSAPL